MLQRAFVNGREVIDVTCITRANAAPGYTPQPAYAQPVYGQPVYRDDIVTPSGGAHATRTGASQPSTQSREDGAA